MTALLLTDIVCPNAFSVSLSGLPRVASIDRRNQRLPVCASPPEAVKIAETASLDRDTQSDADQAAAAAAAAAAAVVPVKSKRHVDVMSACGHERQDQDSAVSSTQHDTSCNPSVVHDWLCLSIRPRQPVLLRFPDDNTHRLCATDAPAAVLRDHLRCLL